MVLAKNIISYTFPIAKRMFATTIKTASEKPELNLDKLSGADDGIFVLGLNRPLRKNAISRDIIKQFSTTLDQVSRDPNARVLILRSLVPGIFCSGADLKQRIKFTPNEVYEMSSEFRALNNQIEFLPLPVIAAIDGTALGGGFEIALACDIRIGASNMKLGLVETKLAIIPGAGGTQRLPRLVGSGVAKELIYAAKIIDAQYAFNLRIVNHLVEQNGHGTGAYEKSLDVAREILPNGPVGVKMAKQAINNGLQTDINTGCAIEGACYAQLIPTRDRIEGLNAFISKRQPKYVGE